MMLFKVFSMKRLFVWVLALLLICGSMVSCQNEQNDGAATSETDAPETDAPETNAPETNAPETNAPETNAPETNAPETDPPVEVVNATVQALKFKDVPVFDGVISEDEWGAPTVTFDKDQKQAYLHHNTGDIDLSATLWLRWDETYLYIGVTSPEPDGQWCPSKAGDNWNGDTIQVRIDPNGANSTGNHLAPFGEGVINACFAMVTETGAMSKYDHSSVIGGDMTDALFSYALNDGVATWEIAIPHSDICAENADALGNIDVDFEYGITVVRLNAAPNQYYNAFLTWGSGVCGPQPDDLCPGSNAVILSSSYAVE